MSIHPVWEGKHRKRQPLNDARYTILHVRAAGSGTELLCISGILCKEQSQSFFKSALQNTVL